MAPRHEGVSQDQWIEVRRRLLTDEKEITRLRRREIPWAAEANFG